VQNTKKITRAMELIAATRVVKAQQRAKDARPYSEHITQVIEDLAAGGAAVDHPLLRQTDEVRKLGVVVISSDRGLAGAFNASVIRAAEREIQAARAAGQQYSLICVGKKAAGYFKFRNYEISAEYLGMSDTPTFVSSPTTGSTESCSPTRSSSRWAPKR
jgi:F-type H+-transporting ATPase subunit gamma